MKREERIANILTYIASTKEPCSVNEITNNLKITQSSVSRVLSSLETLHWVSRSANGFIVGDQLIKLSFKITSKLDIRQVCQPFLKELQKLTQETVVLYLRIGINEICVDQVESDNPLRLVIPYIREFPLWSGCSGKVILAYLNNDESTEVFKSLIKSKSRVHPTGRLLDINKIRKELEIIKTQGYSVSTGERSLQAAAVASPVFENDQVKGAIMITGPVTRFNVKTAQKYSSIIVETARRISRILGSTI
jgi:IclR family transcriptional regulator, KDG regulon repressor